MKTEPNHGNAMVFWKARRTRPWFQVHEETGRSSQGNDRRTLLPSKFRLLYPSPSLSVVEAPPNGVRKGIRVRLPLPVHECESDRFSPASHRGCCDGPPMDRCRTALAAKRDDIELKSFSLVGTREAFTKFTVVGERRVPSSVKQRHQPVCHHDSIIHQHHPVILSW
jgi:hypothetical protein